jgi:hypothetical protein
MAEIGSEIDAALIGDGFLRELRYEDIAVLQQTLRREYWRLYREAGTCSNSERSRFYKWKMARLNSLIESLRLLEGKLRNQTEYFEDQR